MAVQVGPTRAETPPTRSARRLPAAPGWLRRIGIGNLLATIVFTAGGVLSWSRNSRPAAAPGRT